MLDYLKGELAAAYSDRIVVEVNGLAYEVLIAPALFRQLPAVGSTVKVYVVESSGLYGGLTTLYGFLEQSEREIFLQLRDNIPATGAKKALEYFNKVVGDIEKFQQAVVSRNIETLVRYFNFTRKTADKIISALKDKLGQMLPEKALPPEQTSPVLGDVISALVAMGYKPSAARQVAEEVQRRNNPEADFLTLLRQALSIIR